MPILPDCDAKKKLKHFYIACQDFYTGICDRKLVFVGPFIINGQIFYDECHKKRLLSFLKQINTQLSFGQI